MQFTSAPAPGPVPVSVDQRIDSSNKGHQLLSKMGYSGAGLGRKEQGSLSIIFLLTLRPVHDDFEKLGYNDLSLYSAGQATTVKCRNSEQAETGKFIIKILPC